MQSTAKDVTSYIQEASAERQEALIRLRDLCRAALKGTGISVGKGAIRYSKPERIDFNVVESMLRETVVSTGPIC